MILNKEVEQYLLGRLQRGDSPEYQRSIGKDFRSLADTAAQDALSSNLMHGAAMVGSVDNKIPNIDWMDKGSKGIVDAQASYLNNLSKERVGNESRADKVAQIYAQIMQNEEMAKQRQASEDANRAMQSFLAEKSDSRSRDLAGMSDKRARDIAERSSKDRMEMYKLGVSSKEGLAGKSDKTKRNLAEIAAEAKRANDIMREKISGQSNQTRKDIAGQSDQTKRELAGMTDQRARDLAEQSIESKEGLAEKAGAAKTEKAKAAFSGGKALATKPPNDAQNASAGFAKRMEQADKDLDDLVAKGYKREGFLNSVESSAPNFMQGENAKLQAQAERNFTNANLRQESGASIITSEFTSAELQYFPRAGDTPAVLDQKKRNRLQVIESMKARAGIAFDRIKTIEKKPAGKNIKRKMINKALNKTWILYDDNSEETIDGIQ